MEQLPPWLQHVPLPPRPPGYGGQAVPAAAAPTNADDVPSWLAELQDEVAADSPETASQTPAWLSGLAEEVEDQAPASPPPLFPDDTTNSRIRMPVSPTEWLTSIGQDPDAPSEIISEPISTSDESSGVPDWLRDLTDDEVARAVAADEGSEPLQAEPLPGWLADDGLTPDASTVSANWSDPSREQTSADPDVPDWLSAEFGGTEEPERPQSNPALAGGAEIPAWLRDLSDEQAAGTPDEAADEEPSWLSAAAQRPPTDQLGQTPVADIPDWLSGESASPAVVPEEEPDQPPTWIRELSPSPERAPNDSPEGDVPAWMAAPPADESVPAWLQGADEPVLPSTSGDVPAWLQGADEPV
ncbi:MAG: hypothetical protein AB4911_13425, partial [Oscillochloridaceae bacterium umkhey_bin13]